MNDVNECFVNMLLLLFKEMGEFKYRVIIILLYFIFCDLGVKLLINWV